MTAASPDGPCAVQTTVTIAGTAFHGAVAGGQALGGTTVASATSLFGIALVSLTPTANGVSATDVFLCAVGASQTSYTDDGTVAVETTRTPLGRGSTGQWRPAATSLYAGVLPEVFLLGTKTTSCGLSNTQGDVRFGVAVLLGGQHRVGPGSLFLDLAFRYAGLGANDPTSG